MAKYLKPRRGTKTNATSNNIVLKKGEMFLCMSNNDNIGKGPGSLYIGDGASSFSQYTHDGSTVANTAQPFLVHPVLYKPIFVNTNPTSSGWTFNAATAEINAIGDGNGTVSLPTIIGNIKSALCKHADSLNRLNQDLHYAKYINTGVFESDLNDFTDHGYYVFARNSTPTNCPDDWTAAEPFVLQVIRDENAKDSHVDSNIDCQQIIYYGDDTYTRIAKYQNVTVSGTTIFKLVWSEWSKQVDTNTMFDIIYPIGSLYMTIDPNFDPNVSFVGTTWVAIENGIYIKSSINNQTIGDIEGKNTRNINHNHALPFFFAQNTTNLNTKQPWNVSWPTDPTASGTPNYFSLNGTPVASNATGHYGHTSYMSTVAVSSSDTELIDRYTLNVEPRHIEARIWKRTA